MCPSEQNVFGWYTNPPSVPGETSEEAAERIEPSVETLRGKVLRFVRSCGDNGATDEEVQDALSMNPSTERPRRIELERLGFVQDSGKIRLTRSNRKAVVWKSI